MISTRRAICQCRRGSGQGNRFWNFRCVVMAKLPLAGVDFWLRSVEISLTSRFEGCLRRLAGGFGRRRRHILSKGDCPGFREPLGQLRPPLPRCPASGAGRRRSSMVGGSTRRLDIPCAIFQRFRRRTCVSRQESAAGSWQWEPRPRFGASSSRCSSRSSSRMPHTRSSRSGSPGAPRRRRRSRSFRSDGSTAASPFPPTSRQSSPTTSPVPGGSSRFRSRACRASRLDTTRSTSRTGGFSAPAAWSSATSRPLSMEDTWSSSSSTTCCGAGRSWASSSPRASPDIARNRRLLIFLRCCMGHTRRVFGW